MSLDNFDKWWLDQKGDYRERLQKIDVDISSKSNARKYVTGIDHYLRYKRENDDEYEPYKDKYNYSFSEDGSQTREKIIYLSEGEQQDPLVIMQKMGLDPVRWDLEKCELERKGWDVTMKMNQGTDEDGNKLPDQPLTRTNYAFNCKIRVSPITDKIDSDIIRDVLSGIEIPSIKAHEYKSPGKMLEIPIMDPHFGKHAWEDETGEAHYDIDIARELYTATITDMVERGNDTYDKILFPIGQDFYHIDDKRELTTAGTHVDTDGRWQKIYRVGLECLIWAIEHLRQLGPVDVMYVPGNHDEMLSYTATQSLAHYYRGTDSVMVDMSPQPRKYREYGSGMVGFTHGKKESKKRLEKVMQVEQPEMWGRTRYREMHIGDLHHERVWESGGIVFRRISAITATDAWHNEKGYVGATRKAQAFVWDKERGIVEIINSVVDYKE